MRVLGIDPGTAILGYGIVERNGNRYMPIEYGCVRTEPTMPMEKRLQQIYLKLSQLITEFKPDAMAVEELFFNKNVRTALAVGQARGVVLLTGAMGNIELAEYTPLQVKQALVGQGRADKGQVQYMVKVILGLKDVPKPDDVADALAVAICHAQTLTFNFACKG